MKLKCEQAEVLISGYLDQELTQQQQQYLTLHIQECEHCSRLLNELGDIKSAVRETALQSVDAREIEAIMTNGRTKALQYTGWSLLLLGASVVFAAGVYQFFTGTDPLWLKFTVSAIAGGMLFLFGGVLRQRLTARKTDKYRKVTL